MQQIILVCLVAFELCYYLLIAQTGIVEVFNSNMEEIFTLPIGGIIGSYLISIKDKVPVKVKLLVLLSIQLSLSCLYPHFDLISLFFMGLVVGGVAPLIIDELKQASKVNLLFILMTSYTVGTLLFNYAPAERGNLAILLSMITLISAIFIDKFEYKKDMEYLSIPLFIMVFWVFLDSFLFETLSRTEGMSIWREGFTYQIVIFHIIGVFLGIYLKIKENYKIILSFTLFILSYLCYYLNMPILLAIFYPIVISYYNVLILRTLIQKHLTTLAIYMIFIGWISSGMGLSLALLKIF